ncbi:MAG: hypothetical protein AAF768_01050 [Pseudomonadota bacterium]
MMQAALLRHWRLISVVILASGGLLAYHAITGTPGGHSYRHNLPWFIAFDEAFWSGDLYPRHLPELWFGLGGLDFYFYGPMPFWIASLLGHMGCVGGCAPGTAFAMGGAWMIILSGVSFLFLARRYFSLNWAVFAAILYCVLPYHYAMDWVIRQAVGEIAAAIFLPLILLGAVKLLEEQKGGLLLALSFAALVFSHLPVALITVHFLAAFVVWKSWSLRQDRRAILMVFARFALWGGLGAALSAVYWLPALMLLPDVTSSLLYSEHSTPTNWLFLDGGAEPNPASALMIKAIMMSALIMVAFLWMRRRQMPAISQTPGLLTSVLAPVFFAAVLMTPVSWILWEYWIIKSIQFPWRVMILVDLSLALGVTALAADAVRSMRSKAPAIETLLPTSFVMAALVYSTMLILPAAQDATARSGQDFAMTGAPEYFPAPFIEAAREARGPQRGYDSLFQVIEDIHARETAALKSAEYEISVLSEASDRIMLQVIQSQDGPVTLVFPHWGHWQGRMTATGENLALYPEPRFGLMTFDLPAGVHWVELTLPPTLPERFGTWISLIALLFVMGVLLRQLRWGAADRKALATNA